MLEFIIVLLVVLWLLGAFAVHIGGGFIHLLLLIALIILIIRLARGDRVV
jgi:hypothetical protein